MASRKELAADDVSIISQSVVINGDIISQANVRIDGKVTGNIDVDGNLTIGEGSKLNGNIKAINIILNGDVIGKVVASEKLHLESKAKLNGELFANSLIIDEGALFQGSSNMKFDHVDQLK